MIGRSLSHYKVLGELSRGGGEPELLVHFEDPERPSIRSEWASDGKRFYFTLTEHEGDVWVMELQ